VTKTARIWKAVVVVGISLVIASFLGSTSYGMGADASYGEYRGIMIRTSGSFHVEIDTGDHNFSMYLVAYANIMSAMQAHTLENASVLFEMRNIASYSGMIHTLTPGWYALLVTPWEDETISLDIHITKSPPREGVFIPGILLVGLGILTRTAPSFTGGRLVSSIHSS
jgi:hypothetical protein